MNGNFSARLDAVAAARGRHSCWIVPGRGTWSYDDLRSQVARQAQALRLAGVQPGDRVMTQAEKSPEFLLLYLGCLHAGAVFVPLNTAYTEPELRHFALDCEPRLLVGDPARTQALAAVAQSCGATLRTLDAAGYLFLIGVIVFYGWGSPSEKRRRPRETPLDVLQRRLASGASDGLLAA